MAGENRILKDFKCKNRACNKVVGQTNGAQLFLDGKEIPYQPFFISFPCPRCGAKIIWQARGAFPKNRFWRTD